ncbi:hypothetical protein [Cryobacterium sp. TMT2-14]|uniref:hypothetical protein n=1 Tax=Cryobacterium sp. TMT2-14 TaxID=1259245 RepID=UPI00157F8DC0|nr:hypothetical protein [Cryobacterium sp. TMT2-14]
MADYRKILGLLLEGRSYREVVEIAGCSHRDVARVRQEVQDRGLTSMVAVTDAELAKWFPDGRRKVSEEYVQPDLARVVTSMKANRNFTLLLAWRRYVDTKDAGKKYGYSQFCALFTDYLRTQDLVVVLRHEPGRAMLVDWAGDTIDLVDAVTGEITRAVLFVAVLPFDDVLPRLCGYEVPGLARRPRSGVRVLWRRPADRRSGQPDDLDPPNPQG